MFGLAATVPSQHVPASAAGADVGDVGLTNLVLGLTIGAVLISAGVSIVRRSTRARPAVIAGNADASGPSTSPTQTVHGRQRRGVRPSRRVLLGALALLPLPAVILMRDASRTAAAKRKHTIWAEGIRLATDPDGQHIRASDLVVGQLVNVIPANLSDLPETERAAAKAKASVALVRMAPREISPADGRERWHIDGIIAYSKICTHVGCPMGLYERTTHHLLCPCHQSTFDLADNGAVVFGPATRALPQLPLAVDSEGFVVALSDFTEPVGPSYWEREA